MDKATIAKFLSRFGFYKPVRWMYNQLARRGKQTELSLKIGTFKFWTPTFYLDEYVVSLAGERSLLERFTQTLSPSDIVWDVGANIGIYSITSASVIRPLGTVYAIEPEKKSLSLLKQNIGLNSLDNIVPVPVALNDEDTELLLYPSDTPNFGAHALIQRTDYRLKKRGVFVRAARADSLVKNGTLELPNAVKIDVEGAEGKVLTGMRKTLGYSKLKLIMIEIHANLLPLFDSTADEIEFILKQSGFSIEVRRERQNQYHLLLHR